MGNDLTLKFPTGPNRAVIEALEENEILEGWVRHLEAGSALQAETYRKEAGEQVEDGDALREYYQGLDGQTWALDHLVNAHFPNLLRAAAFLAIWGAFERHLTELCREVADARSYQVTVNDLRERGISGVRAYLVKVAGLDGPWARDHWQELLGLQKIRHLFAHGDGRVSLNQEAQRVFVQKNKHLELDGNSVLLSATFLQYLVGLHRGFLQSLQQTIATAFGEDA